MSLKQAFHWTIYFPVGLFAASVAAGLLMWLGGRFLEEQPLLSAMTIFIAFSIAPTVAVCVGFAISHASYEGDEPVWAVLWVMRSPFIIICLFHAYQLITGDLSHGYSEQFPSLAPQIQSLIITAGLLVGTAINILTNISERIIEACL